MEHRTSPQTVVGVYRAQAAAEEAVNRLSQAGFRADEIGLLAPGDVEEPRYFKAVATGIGAGGVLGGAAGAVLGAAAVGAIPGVGPVLAAGALLPVAMGAFTGANAGGLLGGLSAAAITQDQALHYMQEVTSGRTLVTVTTDRVDAAEEAMRAARALEVAVTGASETSEKLLDESAEPD
jgi:hypothetical protein